jgi:protein SCO1/2
MPAFRIRVAVLAAFVTIVVLGAAAVAGVRMLEPARPVAPDFTLHRSDGSPFRLSSLRGRAVALLFGYTHCPDVCPTALAALARAKAMLHGNGAGIAVVFVSVDPQRDSAARVERFARLFDPAFIGLSGSEDDLDPVYAAYHVYRQQIPGDGSTGYAIAHTSLIELIGPAGHVRTREPWDAGASVLAAALRRAEQPA